MSNLARLRTRLAIVSKVLDLLEGIDADPSLETELYNYVTDIMYRVECLDTHLGCSLADSESFMAGVKRIPDQRYRLAPLDAAMNAR